MKRSLEQWLDYQLKTHPQTIAMGLDRIRAVAGALGLEKPGALVLTVGGTNGKGSTVAFAESIALAAGLRVGAFTSPHLLRYNERVRVNGADASAAVLVEAFERIELARDGVPLTYFEFGTLAALLVFQQAGLDLAILEVGLGGSQDAVNIIDADACIITTVDLDHQEYLGNDRETIGADKAGIMRPGKPCVLGERDPPSSVLRHAYRIGAIAIRAQADYLVERQRTRWTWREPGYEISLPLPAMSAPAQVDNAAAAIASLRALPLDLPERALVEGVRGARASGRLQVVAQRPEVVVDVAHNPQAAEQLAAWLRATPRTTRAVFSALRDKDLGAIVPAFKGLVEHWYIAGIADAGTRGMTSAELALRLEPLLPPATVSRFATLAEALHAARVASREDERVLVFGSFHTAAAALQASVGESDRL